MESQRTFGIEIEMINMTPDRAAAVLQAAGINAHREGYNHTTRPYWKVVTDGSLRDNNMSNMNTCEVVSPILQGNEGLADTEKVCNALKAAGATVNKTCGLHVHIGASDLTVEVMKNVFTRYAVLENDIHTFLPKSRVDNLYARRCSLALTPEFKSATTLERAIRAVGNAYGDQMYNRYSSVNLAAYLRHTTVEFRQHSGTVEFEKIKNWVEFTMSFVEASKTIVAEDKSGRETRMKIKKFLLENKGSFFSIAEINAAIGSNKAEKTIRTYLSDIKNPIYAGQSGPINILKRNGKYSTDTILAPEADSVFRGVSPEVAAYLAARATAFATC